MLSREPAPALVTLRMHGLRRSTRAQKNRVAAVRSAKGEGLRAKANSRAIAEIE